MDRPVTDAEPRRRQLDAIRAARTLAEVQAAARVVSNSSVLSHEERDAALDLAVASAFVLGQSEPPLTAALARDVLEALRDQGRLAGLPEEESQAVDLVCTMLGGSGG